jgi:hypothetical protein
MSQQAAQHKSAGIGCNPITLPEWIQAACKGNVPDSYRSLGQGAPSQLLKDLICFASAIGGLEPLAAMRPPAIELVTVYDKTVEVPVATLGPTGAIVPAEMKLIQICAPMGKALVVEYLRALPANLTATQSGDIVFKRLAVMGFSEAFCPPGEPGDGDDLGTFQNVEHVVLRPEAGFDVHARNHSLFSTALFHIFGRMWTAC